MQLVIKNGKIVATHLDSQNIVTAYPQATVITVPDGTPAAIGQAWEITLDQAKGSACARIETARRELETGGVTISWPDGLCSKIQTRDERDWRNINGVASRGLARIMQSIVEEDYFRDADDKNHTLPLPTQALDMGYQAAAAISKIAKAAQDAKDLINSDTVTTPEQIAAIEAAVVWPTT